MAKLYPPSIEGKLPAFAGESLIIPLTMNRAVNFNQVSSMRAMIKTVQTGQLKATLVGALHYTDGKYSAAFNLTGNFQPNLGQYYKVQVAYVDQSGEVGYYSSVGTIKYTSYPTLKIPGLESNFYGRYDYVGTYSQEDSSETLTNPETGEVTVLSTVKRDHSEKVYSYCFELTNSNGEIIASSGTQLHDASTDKYTNRSSDSWSLRRNLQKDIPYYLQYKVVTTNGLEVSSARYMIMEQDSVDIETKLNLISELDYENGSIALSFYPLSSTQRSVIINGSFVLIRSSSIDNFESWNEVYRFTYSNITLEVNTPIPLWEDYSVQQGVEYIYAIQAYNSYDLYSNKILSINKDNPAQNKLYVDFEDAFLYDGERQLKIRYNPKVSSFKETVLESKMDTIGSQFPFIFRNGNVKYKEFPISGLISLQSDPQEKFLKGIQTDLFLERGCTPASDSPAGVLDNCLTGVNIQRERDFKMSVLEWLNNGKPKLFKSPAEGNFIVRLMNVSMSPNDTLGRMLHTFSCTAYEIAACTFDSLIALKLMSLPASKTTGLRIGQISPRKLMSLSAAVLKEDYPDFSIHNQTINMPSSHMVNITEATPGTMVGLSFANGQNEVLIEIGDTGSYYVQIDDAPLIAIRLVSGNWSDAKITFNYYDDTPSDSFSAIANLQLTDEIRQIIGGGFNNNVMDSLEDIRRDIGQFHFIRVTKRHTENVWSIDNEYYRTDIGLDRVEQWDPTLLYYVVNKGYYLNGNKKKILLPNEIDYRFALNPTDGRDYMDLGGRNNPHRCVNCSWFGEAEGLCPECGSPIDSKFGDTFGRIDALTNVEKVSTMYIGTGVIVDMAYRVRTKYYVIEDTNQEVANAKAAWETTLATLDSWVSHPSMKESDYEGAVANIDLTYKEFVTTLERALAQKEG